MKIWVFLRPSWLGFFIILFSKFVFFGLFGVFGYFLPKNGNVVFKIKIWPRASWGHNKSDHPVLSSSLYVSLSLSLSSHFLSSLSLVSSILSSSPRSLSLFTLSSSTLPD